GPARAGDRHEDVADGDLVGVAAELLRLGPDRLVALPGQLGASGCGKDHLAPASGKAPPAPAGAGLNDHRVALRRARDGERPARVEELAPMVEPLDLIWIGVAAGLLIDDDGALVPSIPVSEHDLHELIGPVVAQIVSQVLLPAHVERLAVVD